MNDLNKTAVCSSFFPLNAILTSEDGCFFLLVCHRKPETTERVSLSHLIRDVQWVNREC